MNELGEFPSSILEKYLEGPELQRFHRIKHRSGNYEFRKFSAVNDTFQKLRDSGTERQTYTTLPSWMNEGEGEEGPSLSHSMRAPLDAPKPLSTIASEANSEEEINVTFAQQLPVKPLVTVQPRISKPIRKSVAKRGRPSVFDQKEISTEKDAEDSDSPRRSN
jgi:hypothetical protein